jgi:CheY-like chemotaxis protein
MKTIFVVDDNSTNLLMAEEVLSDHYEVITMASARTMFELLESVTPDLILLDVMMPDIDGFEALEQLKGESRYANIPVVFLTGSGGADTEARGIAMGVADFVVKPFSAQILLESVNFVLQKR